MFDLLRGVRIIDLTTVVMGPYATQLLADMGCEVIKVEPPEGDAMRSNGPIGPGGTSASFLNLNRNKQSVALDLSVADGRDALRRLVETADVFVHNLRPRSAARLGVDAAAIRAIRPDIIYCSAQGYGDGPRRDDPAYDDCIQAASGLAWLNSADGEEPRFVPSVVCDKVAGLHLAFAVATALAARARRGAGATIEVPMFETMASFLLLEHLGGRTFDPPRGGMGYNRLTSANRRPFRTADGWLCVMPYTRAHWRSYLRLVGRDDLCDDPRVNDAKLRAAHIDTLYAIVAENTLAKPSVTWLNLLRKADIPCAEVRRLEDLPADPQFAANGLFGRIDHPGEGRLVNFGSPFVVKGRKRLADKPSPALGQDSGLLLQRSPAKAPARLGENISKADVRAGS